MSSIEKKYKYFIDRLYPGVYSHYSEYDVNSDVMEVTDNILSEITECTANMVELPLHIVNAIYKTWKLTRPDGWKAFISDSNSSTDEVIADIAKWIVGDKSMPICTETVKWSYRRHLDLAFLGLM